MSRFIFDLEGTTSCRKVLKRREFLLGAAALAGGITLAACSNAPSASGANSSNPSANKNYKIALIVGMKGVPFYTMIQKGAQDEAKTHGVTLLIDGPANYSSALQVPIVDAFIAKGVDAIIIAPCDNQSLIAPLQKANDKGIKIITVDSFIGDGDYEHGPVKFPVAYIGSDNTQGGRIAGQALIKAIGGKGKVYLQSLQPGASTTDQREQGFKAAINETNGAVTLAGTNYDGGDISKATQQTAAFLQSNPDVVGIFGANAYSSEGAAAAVKNAGKSGIIKVAHFDSSEQAIVDLRKGLVDLVIGQLPRTMGQIGVQYAVKVLNGDASGLQKHVATNYVVIDRSNVDTPEAQAAVYTN
ncbi:sugar ABC transporter substrate-binding protein [Ktedonosporobacter rubrisoli]|uniref:Sugar ABC transporter substrate-binding protein n=1 Tax=Ktedonosporobacter rubrisoli TaxID=2509675 RepID=A0A4P6JT57_KTERU|nr:ABC transporter substrate-binding protein [Ktedonosporobacter rubrisoli]QBD78759.1 sugar ABC transporter substrate-binding protein [Ktedonosporobacter rubrisoli]